MMDNRAEIRSSGRYWQTPYTRARPRPAVQRETEFRWVGNLTPLTTRPPKWWQRPATLLDALVLGVVVVIGLALMAWLG